MKKSQNFSVSPKFLQAELSINNLFNTFGAVWIPCDYLAGAGRFSGCFHSEALLKIEQLKKYSPEWPQIFR